MIAIDWLKARVPLTTAAPIIGGRVMKIDRDGVVEWEALSKLQVRGSHDSSMMIRSVEGGYVEIDGNPTKFLQGHNVFGTDDLAALVFRTMVRICALLEIEPDPAEVAAWRNLRSIKISRIDLTASIMMGSRSDVRALLLALGEQSRIKWRGRGTFKEGTLYFGAAEKGGRASPWMLKLYGKGDELGLRERPTDPIEEAKLPLQLRGWGGLPPKGGRNKGHGLPETLQDRDRICEWADKVARIELTLRTAELKRAEVENENDGMRYRGFDHGYFWLEVPDVARKLWECYVGKLQIAEVSMPNVESLDALPREVRRTYTDWKDGKDMRTVLSRPTFYRHKAAIKKALGEEVDISLPVPKDNVVQLRRVLIADLTPAPVPAWAQEPIMVRGFLAPVRNVRA